MMNRVLFAGAVLLSICGCRNMTACNGREFDDEPTITLREYVDYLRNEAVKRPTPEERELFPNGPGLLENETTHVINREFQVVGIDERHVSFRADMEDYHGGNGNHRRVFVGTIDRRTGKVLGVEDFVSRTKWPALKKKLHEGAVARLGKDEPLQGEVEVIENFYYAKDGLHFFYNPYEIACGAAGEVEVVIDPKSL